jgi:hypothetical protein
MIVMQSVQLVNQSAAVLSAYNQSLIPLNANMAHIKAVSEQVAEAWRVLTMNLGCVLVAVLTLLNRECAHTKPMLEIGSSDAHTEVFHLGSNLLGGQPLR